MARGRREVDNDGLNNVLYLTHSFHLVLGAGRAALMPFLALYLRLLGLTATHVGVIFGIRACITMIFTPKWMKWSSANNMKRSVLIESLIMMLFLHLSLCFIPPTNIQAPYVFCHPMRKNDLNAMGPLSNKSNEVDPRVLANEVMDSVWKDSSQASSNTLSEVSTVAPITSTETQEKPLLPPDTFSGDADAPATTTVPMVARKVQALKEAIGHTKKKGMRSKLNVLNKKHVTSAKASHGKQDPLNLTEDELRFLRSYNISPNNLDGLSSEVLYELLADITYSDVKRKRRDLLETVIHEWKIIRTHFNLAEHNTFVLILFIFMICEIFAAPYEKLADSLWYEYLEEVGALQYYKKYRVWRSMGFIIMPGLMGLLIDNTPCLLPMGIHHFFLHFLVFAILIIITIFLAVWYPVIPSKEKITMNVGKGVKIMFLDGHSFTVIMTMVVVGAATAVISNFLFWHVQDLGGTEFTMGISVASAGCAAFLMQHFGPLAVQVMESMWSICLGLLMLSGVLAFYSIMWNPWLVVVGEFMHGAALTLLWIAVQTYSDFRLPSGIMDKHVASFIAAMHIGVGVACGGITAGRLYDYLGPRVMFQVTASAILIWDFVFFVVHTTSKKEEKRLYKQVLEEADPDND